MQNHIQDSLQTHADLAHNKLVAIKEHKALICDVPIDVTKSFCDRMHIRIGTKDMALAIAQFKEVIDDLFHAEEERLQKIVDGTYDNYANENVLFFDRRDHQ